MTRLQIGVLLSSILLFFVLYFGCDTKPQKQEAVEKSRALAAESASIEVLVREAKAETGPVVAGEIDAFEQQLNQAVDDSTRIELLKDLSGKWYESGYPAIAGHYAEEVAKLNGAEQAWSIAGTTYTLCLQREEEERLRNFCSSRAVNAYESAISINPSNVAHKVNLALVYTEYPPQDNPMQGVQMLLQLNQEAPENVLILNTLGRLAIRTGQYERALERLEKAVALEPDNSNTSCLLAQAYEGAGQTGKARQFNEKCRSLTER